MPFWTNAIARNILNNHKILIVGHKNSLLSLFKYILNLDIEEVRKYGVPNAMPIVFEFDKDLNVLNNYTLMDLDAHRIKKVNRELSYNNILMGKYTCGEGIDKIRDFKRYKDFKPHKD